MMKKNTLKFIYERLSFLKENFGWYMGVFERATFWNWRLLSCQYHLQKPLNAVYFGRKNQHQRTMQLLGLNITNTNSKFSSPNTENIIISELPFPHSLCCPIVISTAVKLDQTSSFDAVIANINKSRVRYYKKNRHAFRLEQVFSDDAIDFANETMLKPYADSRHGDGVSHLSRNAIIKIARVTGALHLLYFKDEVVGCKVSKEVKYHGQRYWRSIRAGYPEHIFSEPHLFGEIHNMNIFLAMEWAFQNGYDYFDKSICLARPLDKVLQWKRSYRGLFSFMGNYTYFHVSPPKNHESTFFWHSPLFAREHGKLTLHIGIPDAILDEEAIEYLSNMGFGGVSIIFIHCDVAPSAKLTTYINGLFKHFDENPVIKVVLSGQSIHN